MYWTCSGTTSYRVQILFLENHILKSLLRSHLSVFYLFDILLKCVETCLPILYILVVNTENVMDEDWWWAGCVEEIHWASCTQQVQVQVYWSHTHWHGSEILCSCLLLRHPCITDNRSINQLNNNNEVKYNHYKYSRNNSKLFDKIRGRDYIQL